MSSAHRPTWDPAVAKSDNRHASKITSSRDLPSQLTLKYRHSEGGPLPSSNDFGEETRAQLKARLAAAEREARNKKRKAAGLEPEEEDSIEDPDVAEATDPSAEASDEAGFKRPRLPAPRDQSGSGLSEERVQVVGVSADGGSEREEAEDDDEDEDEDDDEINARAREILKQQGFEAGEDESDEEDEDDEDDDDDDETAMLMRELEKIKAERAAAAAAKAEEEQREREKREEEIALGNPLLNDDLKSSNGRATSPSAMSTTSTQPYFGVKRRWDDDVIFKNQSAGAKQDKADFVNDLTRTEFHKEFMHRYIK